MEKTQSIHPRVSGGRTRHEKAHTSKTRNKDILANKIARLEAHCERHPNNAVSAAHLAKLKALL